MFSTFISLPIIRHDRLTNDIELVQPLKCGLRAERINDNVRRKQLWASNNSFQSHKLDTFRNHFGNIMQHLAHPDLLWKHMIL